MNAKTTRKSRTSTYASRLRLGQERGLVAGANVIRNEVRKELRGGYKTSLRNFADTVMEAELASGNSRPPRYVMVRVGKQLRPVGGGSFVTGASVNHVAISEPEFSGGRGVITVGTDLLYNLFWELGHHNLFTRHYERDEKWRPAWRRALPGARAAFLRVLHQTVFGT